MGLYLIGSSGTHAGFTVGTDTLYGLAETSGLLPDYNEVPDSELISNCLDILTAGGGEFYVFEKWQTKEFLEKAKELGLGQDAEELLSAEFEEAEAERCLENDEEDD